MHYCTWQKCGAPATKKIRIRIRHTERIVDENGDPIPSAGQWRDLWRCDEHYEAAVTTWSSELMNEVFIVEF